MAENNQPSIDPANEGSLPGLFRHVLEKHLQNVDDMLPARVVAFDRTSNRAHVQPLIKILTTENQTVSRAPIASVPVFQIGGGQFILNFNLKPGDLGWIKASDRDISIFAQGYDESAPNTLRKHSFEDAIFFPDVMKGFTISDEDQENAVFQSIDGTQRIAIWPDKIKITSETQIVLDAPEILITGNITQGEIGQTNTINGSLHVTGDVTAGTVSLKNHTHTGVQTGGGNTGIPNA